MFTISLLFALVQDGINDTAIWNCGWVTRQIKSDQSESDYIIMTVHVSAGDVAASVDGRQLELTAFADVALTKLYNTPTYPLYLDIVEPQLAISMLVNTTAPQYEAGSYVTVSLQVKHTALSHADVVSLRVKQRQQSLLLVDVNSVVSSDGTLTKGTTAGDAYVQVSEAAVCERMIRRGGGGKMSVSITIDHR